MQAYSQFVLVLHYLVFNQLLNFSANKPIPVSLKPFAVEARINQDKRNLGP